MLLNGSLHEPWLSADALDKAQLLLAPAIDELIHKLCLLLSVVEILGLKLVETQRAKDLCLQLVLERLSVKVGHEKLQCFNRFFCVSFKR